MLSWNKAQNNQTNVDTNDKLHMSIYKMHLEFSIIEWFLLYIRFL